MNKNETLNMKLLLKELKENKNLKNKLLSPENLNIKIKNIKFSKRPKTLSNKLGNKIIKEALILGLREELNHNEKMKTTLYNYLEHVNKLKEKVKKNKEDVEDNCEKLKQEFYDKFMIVDNFEKQINLLNEEKKEIIRTNTEIIDMKCKTTETLKKQFNKIQEETNEQRTVIDELKDKILVLEEKIKNLNNEFEQIKIDEEKEYKRIFQEYLILSEKCEYYQFEYNKYDKYPEEKIKENLNLFDTTKKNDLLTEENLKIELAEKNFVRDKLINNINDLHKQIDIIEEKQKEIKEKEKLYGKPLSSINKKNKKNNTKKKTNLNINTNSNTFMNTTYTNSSSKRAKTVSNRLKNFFNKK